MSLISILIKGINVKAGCVGRKLVAVAAIRKGIMLFKFWRKKWM